MATAKQVEVLLAGVVDKSGNMLEAGKVHTYDAGTLTNKATWTDALKVTPATNPITLDAYGRATIYADGNYKFVIKNAAGDTLYSWDDLEYRLRGTNLIIADGGWVGNGATKPRIGFDDTNDEIDILGGVLHLAAQPIKLGEIANPTNIANKGFVFAKDDGGDTELYYMDHAGNVVQLTKDGAVNFTGVASAHAVIVSMSANQEVGADAWETLEFDTEAEDRGGEWDAGTYQFAAGVDGLYLVTLNVYCTMHNLYNVGVEINHEGAQWLYQQHTTLGGGASNVTGFCLSNVIELAATEVIKFRGYATSLARTFYGGTNSKASIILIDS